LTRVRAGFSIGEWSSRSLAGLCGVLALAGCAANCLRDSDCGDGYECRRDHCELAIHGGDAGVVAGGAGQAGSSQLESSASGEGGAGGGGALGGSAGVGGSAIVTDAGAGGSATGGRENLDASGE
jgi:hypothetical protein